MQSTKIEAGMCFLLWRFRVRPIAGSISGMSLNLVPD